MQRHAQLMYTSCGWFFDDVGGIETVQIIAYAARVLQLAKKLFNLRAEQIEPRFLEQIAAAKSNEPSRGDGAQIYKASVATMELGLEQVAAHYAISSIFSAYSDETELYCYRVRRISYEIYTSGRGRLALGRVHITSAITGEQQSFSFAVLHFEEFARKAAEHVQQAYFPEVIRMIDRYYGHVDYSLTSLFRDEQRRIVQLILNSTLWDIETSLTAIYENHASLLHYLSQNGLPKPPALALAAEFALNAGLRRALGTDPVDQAQVRSLLIAAKADKVQLETAATELPFELNLWQAQNIWYEILRSSNEWLTPLRPEERSRWVMTFNELGECLSIDGESISKE